MLKNLLPAKPMGKRLDYDRLGEWMDAILMRIDGDLGGMNGDLMWALGRVMAFPSYLMPANDDLPDDRGPGDHTPGAQG